jgi:hypothetical protein
VSGHIERSSDTSSTALYQLVAQHLETFLAEAREQHERGLAAYVDKEFRAFLECGIHAFGFLRAPRSGERATTDRPCAFARLR